jgi:membrane protease YdiL (CAAX protease family)
MFFLLKRTVAGGLAGLVALALLGVGLRRLVPDVPSLNLTSAALLTGLAVCGGVLVGDGLVHGALLLLFGEAYRSRYRELAALFRGQSIAALLTGGLMAGLGEELVFRGCGLGPVYLLAMAVVFGAAHHIPGSLAPFTVWFTWEGVLFALAMLLTGELVACMTAHFAHDCLGFLIFRHENRRTMPAAL